MRRLPVYFLIDVSESMVGDQMPYVEEGLASIIKDLRSDPYALETAWVSIIVFAGKTKRIVPLTELTSFYPPRMPIGGGTSFGEALEFLMQDIDTNVVKSTADTKGDWKPIVFLFTDGAPTDNPEAAVTKWINQYKKKASIVAISLGDNTDTALLGRLTNDVLLVKNLAPESYKAFFKWVTASIKTTSMSIAENNLDGPQLAKLDDAVLTKVEPTVDSTPQVIDNNFAVFLSKCQVTKKPYLIKYKRNIAPSKIEGLSLETQFFKLQGSFPVDDSYFQLSDSRPTNQKISSGELVGFPHCPCCGNQYGFSTCACGGIMCTGDEEVSTCPWCNTQAKFGFASGHQDINRSRG